MHPVLLPSRAHASRARGRSTTPSDVGSLDPEVVRGQLVLLSELAQKFNSLVRSPDVQLNNQRRASTAIEKRLHPAQHFPLVPLSVNPDQSSVLKFGSRYKRGYRCTGTRPGRSTGTSARRGSPARRTDDRPDCPRGRSFNTTSPTAAPAATQKGVTLAAAFNWMFE